MDSEIKILKHRRHKKIQSTNNFTDKSAKVIGVRIRKLFNFIRNFFEDFDDTVSNLKDSHFNALFFDFHD